MITDADFIVVGAGSAGCIAAAELARRGVGRVLLLEAGPSDNHPLVKMPFGLAWLMGSKRDWRFKSAPQKGLGGRQLNVHRGRMLGGSGSINSMVWFRGRRDDFDGWNVKGWEWADVEPAFEAVEAKLQPKQMTGVHPLVQALSGLFGGNANDAPTPEYESAGTFRFNMRASRRWSAADAFLRPAQDAYDLKVMTGSEVETLLAGLKRLRALMAKAAFGKHRAPEAYPGPEVSTDEALRQHIKDRGATAYHPVGTLRMGEGTAPVTPRLSVAGVSGLWDADASIMPAVTSANTNAPSMMIGYRAAEFIEKDAG